MAAGWALPKTQTFSESLAGLAGSKTPAAPQTGTGTEITGAGTNFKPEARTSAQVTGGGPQGDVYIPPGAGGTGITGGSAANSHIDPRYDPKTQTHYSDNQKTPEWDAFVDFQFVDTTLQDYQSLADQIAAANRLGIETPDADNRLRDLENQLNNSRLRLADNLGNLDKKGLDAWMKSVNDHYGNDTAAIQRTKEFLLKDLGLRNQGRTNQTKYLQTIFGDIENQLQRVRNDAAIREKEGNTARLFNREGLLANASSRGSSMSAGLNDAQINEENKFRTLRDLLGEQVGSAQESAAADTRQNQRAIQGISEEQARDILGWREDNAGLDTKNKGLTIDRRSNFAKFLVDKAKIDAQEKQRNEERWYGEALRRQQEQQRNTQYYNQMAQAQANAQLQAWNQAQQMRQMNYLQQVQSNQQNRGGGSTAQWLKWVQAGGNIPMTAPKEVRDWAVGTGQFGYNWKGQLVRK